ncbi:MAG: hypothetical protein IID44_06615 [Planctomycetes bacterium]|nr:hypothetical protein [Planctomycetota bacterium]
MFFRPLMAVVLSAVLLSWLAGIVPAAEPLFPDDINITIPHISTDQSIKYDYDIVYVRAQRAGDKIHKRYITPTSRSRSRWSRGPI